MYKTISFTRDEMFERVWSTPLLQLAKEIGVSDVALGKACRRAKIPLPGRGYWAKDAKARQKPKLPGNHDTFYDTIRFRVIDPEAHAALVASRKSMPRRSTADDGNDASAETVAAIIVPAVLEAPHPLVARTLKLAGSAEVSDGRLALDFTEALCVRISPDTLDRSMRILDIVIRESERRGCTWAVTKERMTTVTYDGETMKVELRERLSRREIPPPPPPPESRRGRRPRWQSDYTQTYCPTKEWVSSGELTFLIDERGGHSVRRNWADTKRSPIDTRLEDILDGIAGMAAGIKAERAKHAEWERKRRLEEERQAKLARRAERVRLLRVRLVVAMQRWEQAGRLRRFTSAVEAHLAQVDDASITAGRQWLAWAREQADLLDPVISDFAGVTSLKMTVPSWFTGRGSWEKKPFDWWASADIAQTDDDKEEDESDSSSVEEVPDSSAYWRRVRSGWYGR